MEHVALGLLLLLLAHSGAVWSMEHTVKSPYVHPLIRSNACSISSFLRCLALHSLLEIRQCFATVANAVSRPIATLTAVASRANRVTVASTIVATVRHGWRSKPIGVRASAATLHGLTRLRNAPRAAKPCPNGARRHNLAFCLLHHQTV